MHFLTITLFELGQFLQLVLWIALPMVMLSILVTVYLHYLKRSGQKGEGAPSFISTGEEGVAEVLAKLHPEQEDGREEREAEGETVYQGLLWMKNKYEQDREQATEKYMQLKEEHGKLKEKYQELETRHLYTQELLHERQSTLDRLREQLLQETLRTAEVKDKLESSGHLLVKIHKELDQVLAGHASLTGNGIAARVDADGGEEAANGKGAGNGIVAGDIGDHPAMQPDRGVAEGNHIAAWVESEFTT